MKVALLDMCKYLSWKKKKRESR